jgi:uncharacterized protein YkwD
LPGDILTIVRPCSRDNCLSAVLGELDRMSLFALSGNWPERILIAMGALLVAACSGGPLPSSDEPSFYLSLATKDAKVDAAMAASMISGYRKNNGLGAVAIDPMLMRLAEEHARAMAARDKLDHDVGRSFTTRIRGSGYNARVAVENIGAGYHTLAQAFSGWRDSPPHRANMLNRDASHMGIAAVYSSRSKYKVFWALIMAAPDDPQS